MSKKKVYLAWDLERVVYEEVCRISVDKFTWLAGKILGGKVTYNNDADTGRPTYNFTPNKFYLGKLDGVKEIESKN